VERLFSEYGLSKTPFQYETLAGVRCRMTRTRGSRHSISIRRRVRSKGIYERLQQPYFEALEFVRGEMDSYFFEQIALTLAVERASIPCAHCASLNFPNQLSSKYTIRLNSLMFAYFTSCAPQSLAESAISSILAPSRV